MQDVPIYDGKESITSYLRRTEVFRLKLLNNKYTLLLDFLNDWLKLSDKYKLKSLTEFKNISEKTLLVDQKHNRSILRKYSDKIIKELNIRFDIDAETDSDDIKDNYIITFLNKALSSINYTLINKESNDDTIYSVRLN